MEKMRKTTGAKMYGADQRPVSPAPPAEGPMAKCTRCADNALIENEDDGFIAYMRKVITRLKKLGREGTAKNYTSAHNSFSQFLNGRDVQIEYISAEMMEEYEAWLLRTGKCPNSTSFYMRILRAVYRRAVEEGKAQCRLPFRNVNTRIEKTVKRAIGLEEIRKIKGLLLDERPAEARARDMFLFLFYARGMSFIDAAYLRKTDLRGDALIYRRRKTGQHMAVSMNSLLEELVKKYAQDKTPYLLPVLKGEAEQERREYESALRNVNKKLKKVGELAGLSLPLTTYTARHSWATIAKQKGVTTAVISDALGHESEMTTKIYLSTISGQEIDWANSLILDSL